MSHNIYKKMEKREDPIAYREFLYDDHQRHAIN